MMVRQKFMVEVISNVDVPLDENLFHDIIFNATVECLDWVVNVEVTKVKEKE